MLAYWIQKLENIGCEEVLINTHYLSDKVLEFLKEYKPQKIKIYTSYEEDILEQQELY